MHETPKISVIVAVYNSEATFERCLESVRAQTYANKELIVIDGGSSDGTMNIIKSREGLIDYWQSERDGGIYEAWNKGLDHVTGDWVHFLGADDYFPESDILDRVAAGIRRCPPHIRVVFGKEAIVSESGEILFVLGDSWENISSRFLVGMALLLPHTAAFHHVRLFEDHGRFDESFRIAGDYEFLLRELKYRPAQFLPDVVVKAITCSGVSKDWSHSLESVREVAKAKRMNGIFPYHLRWVILWAKAVGKNLLRATVGSSVTRSLVDSYRRVTGRDAIWTKMR
jgi:glycosyltransferase involved in cell wall biosynthesis